MLILPDNDSLLRIVTGQAVTTDVHASYVDSVGNVAGSLNTPITGATTTTVVGSPSSGVRNVKVLSARNKHASSSVDITVLHTDGTTAVEVWKITLLAGETLFYSEETGFVRLGASVPVLGGIGTPATAAQSLTASSANVLNGTLVQLPTANLKVGSRFRFYIGLLKTAAGTATWTAAVKWGTNGTTGDAAVATWTSGTNTAAVDGASLIIECTVATLGATGTWNCIAYYANTLTPATGLGSMTLVPGSTATFDSTATAPYIHIDVTPGASAVMTSVAAADRIA